MSSLGSPDVSLSRASQEDGPATPAARRLGSRRGQRTAPVLWVLLSTMGLFCAASFVAPVSGNPDYEPYQEIYEIGAENFASDAPLFFAANQAAKLIGLDYDQFREATLLVSLVLLGAAVLRFGRRAGYATWGEISPGLGVLPLSLIAAVGLSIFLVEFLEVRIRAGLALSVVALAFSLYLSSRRPNSVVNLLAVSILLVGAYAVHASTALVLGYLLFAPAAYELVSSKLRHFSHAVWFGLVPAVSFCLVYFASLQSGERGEQLVSPLNAARLAAVSIVPLLLVLWEHFASGRRAQRDGSWDRSSGAGHASAASAVLQRRLSWTRGATVCYASMAFALLVLYVAGFIGESGEAMVRIFTLSSVPALFVLLRPSRYWQTWLFLLVSNSLFFVNSLAGGILGALQG